MRMILVLLAKTVACTALNPQLLPRTPAEIDTLMGHQSSCVDGKSMASQLQAEGVNGPYLASISLFGWLALTFMGSLSTKNHFPLDQKVDAGIFSNSFSFC